MADKTKPVSKPTTKSKGKGGSGKGKDGSGGGKSGKIRGGTRGK